MIQIKTPKKLIFTTPIIPDGMPVLLMATRYRSNGNVALQLISDDHIHEPVCSLTCNTDIMLDADEVAIKDYSENEGVLDWMLETGLCELTSRAIHSGFVLLPIVKLSSTITTQLKALHHEAH